MFVLIGIKNPFSFHQLNGGTVFHQRYIVTSSSLGIFKHSFLKYLQFPTHNYLFYIGYCSASVSHTCLGLNFSALKYHFFQKNCCQSPACPHCNATVEDPKLYFLHYLSFAAPSASCLPPLHNYSEIGGIVLPIRKKIDWFLNSISHDDFDTNVMFLQHVQSYISLFNRFCQLTSIPLCMFCSIVTCDMHCRQHKLSS